MVIVCKTQPPGCAWLYAVCPVLTCPAKRRNPHSHACRAPGPCQRLLASPPAAPGCRCGLPFFVTPHLPPHPTLPTHQPTHQHPHPSHSPTHPPTLPAPQPPTYPPANTPHRHLSPPTHTLPHRAATSASSTSASTWVTPRSARPSMACAPSSPPRRRGARATAGGSEPRIALHLLIVCTTRGSHMPFPPCCLLPAWSRRKARLATWLAQLPVHPCLLRAFPWCALNRGTKGHHACS